MKDAFTGSDIKEKQPESEWKDGQPHPHDRASRNILSSPQLESPASSSFDYCPCSIHTLGSLRSQFHPRMQLLGLWLQHTAAGAIFNPISARVQRYPDLAYNKTQPNASVTQWLFLFVCFIFFKADVR